MVSKRRNQARRRPRTAQRRTLRRAPRNSRGTRRGTIKNAGTEPSIARVIARGVKELVSGTPIIGGVLGSLADFVFKAVGVSQTDMSKYAIGTPVSADVSITRLYSRFQIYPVALLVGSRAALPTDTNRAVTTPYLDGRVISMTVTIRPENAVLYRQGEWHLSIQPYFNVTDDPDQGGIASQKPPYEEAMRRCYLSTTGQRRNHLR